MLTQVHPVNPQARILQQVIDTLKSGGLIIGPTDCTYTFLCLPGSKKAVERIRKLRNLETKHLHTIICSSLRQVSNFAKVSNQQFRQVKKLFPGNYTIIFEATPLVPSILLQKRKTIGIRMMESSIINALIEELDSPLLCSSLNFEDIDILGNDPYEIDQELGKHVDQVIDAGYSDILSTTVLDYSDGNIEIIREGAGSVDFLQ